MKLIAIFFLTLVALVPAAHAAELSPTRPLALHALSNPDPEARRAAARQLAAVGRMADVAELVKALRDGDEATRATAEAAIWEIWGRSGDAEIDALYQRGVELMNVGAAGEAIRVFTAIVRKKPDFAEGWNKRATLYYTVGEYVKSLHDCDEVIKRNPLHFGALAGYGLIYLRMNQPERALGYLKRALKINPNMPGVESNIELLQKQLDDKRKKYI